MSPHTNPDGAKRCGRSGGAFAACDRPEVKNADTGMLEASVDDSEQQLLLRRARIAEMRAQATIVTREAEEKLRSRRSGVERREGGSFDFLSCQLTLRRGDHVQWTERVEDEARVEKEARDFTYASPELSGTGSMLSSSDESRTAGSTSSQCLADLDKENTRFIARI